MHHHEPFAARASPPRRIGARVPDSLAVELTRHPDPRPSAAYVLPRWWRVDDSELLEHPELIEGVPAFHELSVLHANEHHPAETHLPARGRKAQVISSMCSGAAPAGGDHLALGNDVLDPNRDVGKCAAVRGMNN